MMNEFKKAKESAELM